MIRKILLILTRKEKKHLVIHMLLDILIAIADIGFLALLLLLLNHYTNKTGQPGRWAFAEAWFDGKDPMLLIIVFFLLFSGKNGLAYFIFRDQLRYLMAVASRISRNKLLAYLEGSYTNYVNVDTSVHIRAISYHPRDFSLHVLGGIQQIFTQSLLIVLAVAGIALFDVKLFGLLLLILLPPVFVSFYFMRKKLNSVRVVSRTSSEKYLQHLQEALAGFVESNVYHKQEAIVDRYLGVQREFNESVADQQIILGIPSRLVEVFAIFGLVIIIGLSYYSGNGDGAAVLTIGVFMAAAYKIIPGIVKIMNSVGQMNTYAFTMDHLAVRGEEGMNGVGCPVPVISRIDCRRLVFTYNGQRILNEQDLEINAGEFVGICGPSGRGKSTILNLLLGFLTPDGGDISINGVSTDAAARRAYWGRIAYVKQQPFLLHDTVLYNVTLGGGGYDRDRLEKAAGMAGLLPMIDSFDKGWDKVIAENGKNISGGQRQRVAFTRALYKNADLLILDEPFSELDEESEREMMDLCLDLTRRGKTILLITHNRENLSFCHKTVVLDES
ncbi:MAG TPA: ABC transporter ATP-binding protein [Puia sp.]|jgi:ABC-type multidrug transport system fused ATPase/permease subunit